MEADLIVAQNQPTAAENLQAMLVILFSLPISAAACVLRRLLHTTSVPFQQDLLLSIVRRTTHLGPFRVPVAYSRSATSPKLPLPALSSKRFPGLNDESCKKVQRKTFAGYWISLSPLQPEQHNIIILFIHGGGYNIGHPLQNLTSLLRLTEILSSRPENKITLATLSLNYTLAPEAAFPTQQDQALAAYQYLTNEIGIPPQKIIFYGESAGGHLTLSLLMLIRQQKLPKPGGAYLLAPWVDLTNSGDSFNFNKTKDALTKVDLDRCASNVLGGSKGREKFCHLLNLSSSDRNWKAVLPDATYVNVGDHEVFLTSILKFTTNAKENGVDIELETVSGRPHAWQGYIDGRTSAKYLSLAPGEDIGELMLGAKNISTGMIKLVDTLRSTDYL